MCLKKAAKGPSHLFQSLGFCLDAGQKKKKKLQNNMFISRKQVSA